MYKKMLSWILLICVGEALWAASSGVSETVKTLPEKPRAGQSITIFYNPSGALLANAEEVTMFVAPYNKEVIRIEKVAMKREKNIWIGKVKVAEAAHGLCVVFASGKEIDSNKHKGYLVKLFDEKGHVLPFVELGYASVLGGSGRTLDIQRDIEKALCIYEKEFEKNPGLKHEFLTPYLKTIVNANLIAGGKRSDTDSKILAELEAYERTVKLEDLDEKDLLSLHSFYGNLRKREKAEQLKILNIQKYPKGLMALSEEIKKFDTFIEPDEKAQFVKDLIKKFNPYKQRMVERVISRTISAFGDRGEYEKAYAFLQSIGENALSVHYRDLASQMLKKETELEMALEIAEKAVELARNDLEIHKEQLPGKFIMNVKFRLIPYLSLCSEISEKLNRVDEALKFAQETYELMNATIRKVNEDYVRLLVKAGKNEKAKAVIETVVASDKGTNEMTSYLKRAYIKVNGSEKGFDEYLAKLEEKAKAHRYAELKELLVEEPAPLFTLKDLDGREVSFSEFRGRTVILDFWALWCGPCIVSFPAMKKAIEKFSGSKNVKFLFIDTWERGDNVAQRVAKFIKENNYPFHVLLDEKSEAVRAYKVRGIPTKFVVDKNGNIRFKRVGGGQSAEELLNELEAVIALVE